MLRNRIMIVHLFALSLILVGCPNEGSVSDGGTSVDFKPPPANNFACDPFDGSVYPGATQFGAKGILYYRGINDPPFTSVNDYFLNGLLIPDTVLYFNQIHIPTRPFDRGFVTQAGEPIKTPDGDVLYEWFAVKFSGRFTLAPEQPEGYYEFSLLADDGAVLKVDQGNGMEILVDDDGTHPTKMGCTNTPIYLDHDNPVPFELDYNQGPRFHIAMVVLMRPWSDNNADPRCGQQGNSLFFDSTQDPPAPKAAYNELLSRGWAPLAPDNYLLPSEESNPCNEAAPVISNVAVGGITRNSVNVSWITDVYSTSKIVVTNASTGESFETAEDLNYVQLHSVVAQGLSSNTLYRVKAVSASSSGLSSESSEISFRTLR